MSRFVYRPGSRQGQQRAEAELHWQLFPFVLCNAQNPSHEYVLVLVLI